MEYNEARRLVRKFVENLVCDYELEYTEVLHQSTGYICAMNDLGCFKGWDSEKFDGILRTRNAALKLWFD